MTGWKDFVKKLGRAYKAIAYHLLIDILLIYLVFVSIPFEIRLSCHNYTIWREDAFIKKKYV